MNSLLPPILRLRFVPFRLRTILLVACVPLAGFAQVVSDFGGQNLGLDEATSAAFPGTAGDGWQGPWTVRRYLGEDSDKKTSKKMDGVEVAATDRTEWPRALKLSPLADASDTGLAVARAYQNNGGLDIGNPYQISLQILLYRIPNRKYSLSETFVFIGENGTDAVNPTRGTTWFLQGFLGPSAGKPVVASKPGDPLIHARQRQWNVAGGGPEDALTYVPTGIALEEGVLYTIKILINPSLSSYRCIIEGDGGRFESDVLRFPSNKPLGRNIVIGSRYPAGNAFELLVGDVMIQPAGWN